MKRCARVLLALSCWASVSFGATHIITFSGLTFSPDNITVAVGDTVQFNLISMHNAIEVTHATWLAGDTTGNGGFRIPFGGGTMVMTDLGTHYFVCQNHVSFGMKGIITVTAATNSITIESIVDEDGKIASTVDRVPKNWSLKLYKGSVSPGSLVDSIDSGTSLTVDSLFAGTYIAVEADSGSWSHLSISIDSASQGVTSLHQWPLTVSANENHVIDFLNFAPHTIVSVGYTFYPESLAVIAGDTVRFVLDPMHKPREVSASTWLANDTVANGGFDLPYGEGSTVLTTIGIHYYVCVPHASIGMKGRIVVLSGFAMATGAGWNMISLPLALADSNPAALFPSANSKAFKYQGSYVEQNALRNGVAYWLKFPTPTSTPLAGAPIGAETLDVVRGWNMIGSLTAPVPVSSIGQIGATALSSFFGYSTLAGYFAEDTLKPGLGYWVKMNQAGQLALHSAASIPPSSLSYSNRAGRNTVGDKVTGDITISDQEGQSRHLSIVNGTVADDAPEIQLPPPGPEGILDARFAGDRSAATFDGRETKETAIQIASAAYPLTVSWNLREPVRGLHLSLGVQHIDMNTPGTVRILDPGSRVTLSNSEVGGTEVPSTYALLQNYPNPFNPSTAIRYQLPVESRVTVSIYNLLGEKLEVLVDETENAGFKSVEWNAAKYGSGIYFYRLQATPAEGSGTTFLQVRRMLLVR